MSVSVSGRINQTRCLFTVKNHFLLNASLSTAQETNNSQPDSWFELGLGDGQAQAFVVCWHCFHSPPSLQRKPRPLPPLSSPSLSSSVSDGRLSSLQLTKDSGVLSTGNVHAWRLRQTIQTVRCWQFFFVPCIVLTQGMWNVSHIVVSQTKQITGWGLMRIKTWLVSPTRIQTEDNSQKCPPYQRGHPDSRKSVALIFPEHQTRKAVSGTLARKLLSILLSTGSSNIM